MPRQQSPSLSLSLSLSLYRVLSLTRSLHLVISLARSLRLSLYPSRSVSLCRSVSPSLSRSQSLSRWTRTSPATVGNTPPGEFLRDEGSSRFRADMAHIRQSRPDSGLGFQVKVLKTCYVALFSLRSGAREGGERRARGGRSSQDESPFIRDLSTLHPNS